MPKTVDDISPQANVPSLDGTERLFVIKQGYAQPCSTAEIAALAGGASLNIITPSPGAGPYTNGNAANGLPGYTSGVTNVVRALAASGGTTFNSLDMSGASNNFEMFWENTSQTDYLFFPHLTGGSGTQFSNAQGLEVAIPPLGTARIRLMGGKLHVS